MSEAQLKIAIVGATGVVGQVALDLFAARNWPADRLIAMASTRSIGRKIRYGNSAITVSETTPDAFKSIDVTFISANSSVSRAIAPEAASHGSLVIDDGNAFRMQDDVPLVVPEINPEDVEWHNGIISIPNCTTTPLVMVLDAMRKARNINRVTIATYQAVSGTGASAVQELEAQDTAIAAGHKPTKNIYPHQIARNVMPQVDDFKDDGYSIEEHKMEQETRKILHMPELLISATCVRVPVLIGHSEAVNIEFDAPLSPEDAKKLLVSYPGIALLDDPTHSIYPTPLQSSDKNEVFVGRVRKDRSNPNGIVLWLSCDNLRKGAALNALQIMDETVRRKRLKPIS